MPVANWGRLCHNPQETRVSRSWSWSWIRLRQVLAAIFVAYTLLSRLVSCLSFDCLVLPCVLSCLVFCSVLSCLVVCLVLSCLLLPLSIDILSCLASAVLLCLVLFYLVLFCVALCCLVLSCLVWTYLGCVFDVFLRFNSLPATVKAKESHKKELQEIVGNSRWAFYLSYYLCW